MKDINPGPVGSSPSGLTAIGDTVYFSANDGVHGRELWKTDGTEAGTTLVKVLTTGQSDSRLEQQPFAAYKGELYFSAWGDDEYYHLWKTDGTEAGTVEVNPRLWEYGVSVTELTVSGDFLYFAFGDYRGYELWKTDGTADGTSIVRDISPGHDSGNPWALTGVNGTLFFFGCDQEHGCELWKSDGTEAGTVHVAPGRTGVTPQQDRMTAFGGAVYFFPAGAADRGLWRCDGTDAGTFRILSVNEPVFLADASVNGRLFFGISEPGRIAPWTTDGTAAGTAPLKDGLSALGGLPESFADSVWNGHFLFAGGDGVHGAEPWASDGTAAGTFMIVDLLPTTLDSVSYFRPNAGPVALDNGRLLFPGDVVDPLDPYARIGPDVWATDGTGAGTAKVLELNPSGNYQDFSSVGGLARLNASAGVILAADASGAGHVWVTDGTAAGTARAADVRYEGVWDGRAVESLVEMNGFVYFSGGLATDSVGFELARTDGTAAGTTVVKDLSFDSSRPRSLTRVGNTLYFTAFNAAGAGAAAANELWKSDGTAAGTVRVKSFRGSAGESRAAPPPVDAAGTLFFRATGPAGEAEIWKTNGTEAGTVLVKRFAATGFPLFGRAARRDRPRGLLRRRRRPERDRALEDRRHGRGHGAGQGHLPRVLRVVPEEADGGGGQVVFHCRRPHGGVELWESDGTAQGTVPVLDIRPGREGSGASPLVAAGGLLYFAASDAAGGNELWVTDGTGPGTRRVEDVAAGPADSDPFAAVAAGDKVVFWVDDQRHGREPWVTPPPPRPAASVVARHVFYAGSASAGAGGDGAIAPDKAALLPGQAATFANVTSYSRGLNGIMIDFANLAEGAETSLSADDFSFRVVGPAGSPPPPAPASVTVRRGGGVNGSDRVTLVWADYSPAGNASAMALANGWLGVTVKAGADTGLASPDMFSFGNLIGDTGGGGATNLRVDALDLGAVKRALNTDAAPISTVDLNRDGRVNALDLGIIKRNLNQTLGLRATPIPAEAVRIASAVGPGLFADDGTSPRWRLADEVLV